jgi:hypothetical protein
MKAIEDSCIVNASLNEQGQLIFTRRDGQTIYTGNVVGPKGDQGTPGQPSSVSVVGNTVPMRTGNGRIKAALAEQEDDVISRKYLEEYAALTPLEAHRWLTGENAASRIPSGVNLDTLTTPGVYFQPANISALVAYNYPEADRAGMLEVFNNKTTMVWQRYTKYGDYDKDFYARSRYNNTWSPWTIVGQGSLPAPQYTYYNGIVDITASGPGVVMPKFDSITINNHRDLWVDVRLKAYGRTNGSELLANVHLSGSTSTGWPFVTTSNVLYTTSGVSHGSSLMLTMAQVYKLNAGSTVFKVEAYRNLGTGTSAQFLYPMLQVVPLRWA